MNEKWLNKIICGDCLEVMKEMEDESIDTIITDPPYGLEFMGKEWDTFKKSTDNIETKKNNPYYRSNIRFRVKGNETGQALQRFGYLWAKEALRIAKPGAIMLCFGGTRTFHRIACGIEDAGWEIRDTLMWIYGSGFPKSHNIGKATEQERWQGYGTALKPAYEPIIMAMKPRENTYAENALEHDVAGLNIDRARIGNEKRKYKGAGGTETTLQKGALGSGEGKDKEYQVQGRFPANLIHDGSKEATKDMGDKSRYFYCAKASKEERNIGLEDFEEKDKKRFGSGGRTKVNGEWRETHSERKPFKNNHPTVKPLALMEYLVELTKMPNKDQIYLDPFVGSGTTAMAVKKKGRNYIGIEKEKEYVKIAKARIKTVQETLI